MLLEMVNPETFEPIYIGRSADLRCLYPDFTPGQEILISKETYINSYAMNHIENDHPERTDWVTSNIPLMQQAIEHPEIVYRQLVYKEHMDHWSQAFVIQVPDDKRPYFVVIVSFANTDGEKSEYHQVITAFAAKRGYIEQRGALKDLWMSVKTA